ncbi:MAG: response regulator [Alkalispirochaetaceae bacterium]
MQQDRRNDYRRKAEEIVDKHRLSPDASEEKLIYELKVHQIELEMQNSELQSTQQELLRARRQYELLFEYAPVPYFVFNLEGGIIEANEAGAALLRGERKHLNRKPFVVFLPREFHVPFFNHLRKVFATGEREHKEIQIIDRDGRNRWVRLESRRQVDPQGAEQCLTAVSDLSETRQIKEDLAAARSEALRAAESEPVSSKAMLYEARAPMEGIVAALEQILPALPGGGEATEKLEQLRATAASVVESLRETANRDEEEGQTIFGVEQLLSTLEPMFAPSLTARRNSLISRIDPGGHQRYIGDLRRIRQVLVALVSNANKFSEDGTITLRAEESGLSDQLVELTISVEDTGRGIEAERHREIFQGTGDGGGASGLALARQLVRRIGGQIYFESTPGSGTTFFVSLPLRVAETSEEKPPGKRERGPEQNGEYSILVAEDNAINVLVLRTLLERAGYRVVCVENGREAVEKLRGYPFDLVLMDISMPILDGVRATEQIRSGESGVLDPTVPVIAITAHAMKGDREKFLAAGMNDYIAKPFSKEVVMERVREFLSSRRPG